MFAAVSVLLLTSAPSFGQSWSGILAPARAYNWSNAGIPGGIPTGWANCTTTACNTLYNTPTAGSGFAANVNAAIASAPANSVVRIPAGTFNLTGSINSQRSRVILRGAGPMNTRIIGNSSNRITFGWGNYESGQGKSSWTGGLTRGSTVLTVGSTASLHVGQTLLLDQLNPFWVDPDNSLQSPCTAGNSCGRCPTTLGIGGRNCQTRAFGQLTKIVSIDSPTQLTIKDPVSYTHTAELSPEIFWWDACSDSGRNGNCEYMGIEDLYFDADGPDADTNGVSQPLNFPLCDYCWAKNVWVFNGGRGFVAYLYSYGGEVRDSYFDHTPQASAPTQYGFDAIMSSNIMVVNNIFYGITASVMPEASFGLVVAYNYARQHGLSENFFANMQPHLAHNAFQLYEGNVMDGFNFDNIWGSSSHSTLFRNRINGVGNNKQSNYRSPVFNQAHSRYHNYVGNVLGDPTFHVRYACDDRTVGAGTTVKGDGNIYVIGGNNGCQDPIPWDTLARTSMMRWGNWDAVTYKANGSTNGVRWCTASATGNPACTEDERGASDPTFPALASPATSLPASFFLGGKPAWFGNVPWPAIGPDVSCSGASCEPNAGGRAYKIPAQLCYENSAKNASGNLTAFDPGVCYRSEPSSRPEPPSALVVE